MSKSFDELVGLVIGSVNGGSCQELITEIKALFDENAELKSKLAFSDGYKGVLRIGDRNDE